MSKRYPITQRGSAVHRVMTLLQAGPMRRDALVAAGIKPSDLRHALKVLRDHGWGDCALQLSDAGRQALADLESWRYDPSLARQQRRAQTPMEQIAQIVRQPKASRWP